MPKRTRRKAPENSERAISNRIQSVDGQSISSEEAIRAGEQIAMAAFASGLKLAAAFGTVAAKTAGLALASLASGADKFSELVREEAARGYGTKISGRRASTLRKRRTRSRMRQKKKAG